jgi:hypothetical protein
MLAGPMAAPAPARALLPALLAALVATGAAAPSVSAAEDVPVESGTILLPGDTYGAMVGDVNGDGQRELVRLRPWSRNPGQLSLEIIAVEDDEADSRGQVLLERAASVEDYVAGNNPDQAELLPLTTSEPALLLAWRDGGRERVLLATMQGNPSSRLIERSCCLTLWSVGLDENGATEVELIQNTAASGAWIVAADMDADGTDELAVVETPNPAIAAASEILVLHWNGRDFDRLRDTAQKGIIEGPLTVLGDSDGLPGDEVGYVALPGSFDRVEPTLHRFALVDGQLRIDRTELPEVGDVLPIAGADGGRVALVAGEEVHLLRWPASSRDATVELTSPRGGEALGVLGSDESARLLVLRGGAVDILDAQLRSRQGLAGGLTASWFVDSSLPPYHGPLHGGDETGQPALVFGGRLVVAPRQPDNQVSFRDIAVLPGKVPVGLLGPGLGWAAVADGPLVPAARQGGGLLVAGGARAAAMAIVRTDVILRPESDGGLLEPTLTGALLDDSQPARPILLTGGAVDAVVSAPEGSHALVRGRDGGPEALVPAGGRVRVRLVADDPEATEDERFTTRLLVSTPAGHGYGAIWEVRVERRPPGLTAAAPMLPLGFSVPLTGRTDPNARLVVDGAEVPTQPDGSFRAEVGAGPLPRQVRLRATDPLGNSTELVLEVVGVIDYRRLPWIPIIVVLTLATAAFLFLRAPRPTAVGMEHPDEGVLEEIQ